MDDRTAENLIAFLTDHPEAVYDREGDTCNGYFLSGVWMSCGCSDCKIYDVLHQDYYGRDGTGDHH